MMFLVLLRRSGAEWDRSRAMEQQSRWRAHADYMDQLVEHGVIVLGGPVDDGRVVLAVEAESESTVRTVLAGDPWSETHLVLASVQAWDIRLDGRRAEGER